MRRILIVGQGSYIGTSFARWLAQWPDEYSVDTIDARDGSWRARSFGGYDSVLHVAGIAHMAGKPKEELYMRVNRDLAIESAEKAKKDGAKQFIFMSSMSVYDGYTLGRALVVDHNTLPRPSSPYGRSKYQAEEGIRKLHDDQFKVVIIRAPMIYGKGCPGNYNKIAKLARKTPLFPDIDNQRSMLHIDNLCELIRLLINNEEQGIFFPQNDDYVNTSTLVKLIAQYHGKKMKLTKIFNPVINIMKYRVKIINKMFGDLVYKQSISEYKENYRINNFEETIILTEKSKYRYPELYRALLLV